MKNAGLISHLDLPDVFSLILVTSSCDKTKPSTYALFFLAVLGVYTE